MDPIFDWPNGNAKLTIVMRNAGTDREEFELKYKKDVAESELCFLLIQLQTHNRLG